MSKYPTQPAFIYGFPNHDFDDQTRAHPAPKYLETYLREVVEDARWDLHHHGADFHPEAWPKTGSGHSADDAADHFQVLQKLHASFESYYRAYDHIIVYETDDGWISLGTANFFHNTKDGVKAGKDRPIKSRDDRSWEAVSPGAYRGHFVKGKDGGVQMVGVEIYNGYMEILK